MTERSVFWPVTDAMIDNALDSCIAKEGAWQKVAPHALELNLKHTVAIDADPRHPRPASMVMLQRRSSYQSATNALDARIHELYEVGLPVQISRTSEESVDDGGIGRISTKIQIVVLLPQVYNGKYSKLDIEMRGKDYGRC